MPRYFFDCWDHAGVFTDEVGVELPDFRTARQTALLALSDAVKESASKAREQPTIIKVREGRKAILVAHAGIGTAF